MKSKKKYLLSILFFVILLVLTFYILFKNNDIQDVLYNLKHISYKYLFVGVGLVLIYLFIEGVYIKISLKSLNCKINLWQGFVYSCTEFYFSAITPSSTGGQPAQAYYMSKDGVPLTKSSVVLILNTITFKIVIILMGIFAMIFYPSLVFNNSVLFTVLFLFGIVCNFNMILLCLALMYSKKWIHKIVTFIINLGAKLHLVKDREGKLERIHLHIAEYQDGANYVKKHLMVAVKVILLTFVQRLAMFSIAYVVYKAFGLNTYSYLELVVIQIGVALAIDSLPLPGGIGASEALLLLIYTKVFSQNLVVPAMLVTRGLSYYLCLIISGLTVLQNHLRVLFKKDYYKISDKN